MSHDHHRTGPTTTRADDRPSVQSGQRVPIGLPPHLLTSQLPAVPAQPAPQTTVAYSGYLPARVGPTMGVYGDAILPSVKRPGY